MSASEGSFFPRSSAQAVMIIPGWQKPHWATSSSSHALWHGCERSGESPSMVVKERPAASAREIWQERTALPFCSTVHAPQAPMPQPYFVPVRPRRSRSTHSSGMSAGASTVLRFPLMTRLVRATARHFIRDLSGRGQITGYRRRDSTTARRHDGGLLSRRRAVAPFAVALRVCGSSLILQ